MADQGASPWKLGGLSKRELARRVWKEASTDGVTTHAAALAYYFLFALFPALLFLVTLLGFLQLPNLSEKLTGTLGEILPGTAGATIAQTLNEALQQQRGGLLSIGALLALWSASAGMAGLMDALNVAYDVEDARAWWKRRLVALILTLAFSILLIGGLGLLVFAPHIADAIGIGGLPDFLWTLVSVPAALALAVIGVAVLYYFAPAVEQRWRWVTPGSAVAVALWLLMSIGLRIYVAYFGNYNATYGSIGGVILLMLWLYLTGLVLLFGAEVNAEIEHAAARRGAADAKAAGQRAA